jgi:DNA-binding HxlR family transcriptional regulator
MVERGVGSWQIDKARTAVQAVVKILKDGEWHRYQELRQKAGLSSATLSKHLKELEKGVVEKKIQLKSGEYPYPVFYRIKEQYQTFFRIFSIPDARELGRKTRISKKKLTEVTEAYMGSINQALSISTEMALSIYAAERNAEAFHQSLDSSLEAYRKAAQVVQETFDSFHAASEKALAPVEELIKLTNEVSRRIDEAAKIAQSNASSSTLAEGTDE